MPEVASLKAVLSANTNQFEQAMSRSQRRMEQATRASKRLMTTVGLLAGATAGLGLAGVRLAGQMEQAEIAFTTLLGSAKKADKFLRDLADFAKNTPFEFMELQGAAKRMMAYGFAAEQVLPTLRTLGDATAALGGGSEMINRVTLALGQMQAKGVVSAEEMRQLAESGLPAWEILADAIGVSIPEAMKLAENRAIDSATAIPAILDGMNERFAGLMERQSKTILGKWSNMIDQLALTGIAFGNDLVETFALKEVITAATNALENLRILFEEKGLKGIWEEQKGGIMIVAGAITGALVPAFYALATAAAAALVALAPFLLGGAVVAGLVVLADRMFDVGTSGEETRRVMKRLGEQAGITEDGIKELTKATDERGFRGAIGTLAQALDQEGKAGLIDFAESVAYPMVAQGELRDAIDLTIAKFAEMRVASLQAERETIVGLQNITRQQIDAARNNLVLMAAVNARRLLMGQQLTEAQVAGYQEAQAAVEELESTLFRQLDSLAAVDQAIATHELTLMDLASGTITAEEALERLGLALGIIPESTRTASSGIEDTGDAAEEAADKIDTLAGSYDKLGEAIRRFQQSQAQSEFLQGGNTVGDAGSPRAIPVPGVSASAGAARGIPVPAARALVSGAVSVVLAPLVNFNRAMAQRMMARQDRINNQVRFGSPEALQAYTNQARAKHGAISGPVAIPVPGVSASAGGLVSIPVPGVSGSAGRSRAIPIPGVTGSAGEALPIPVPGVSSGRRDRSTLPPGALEQALKNEVEYRRKLVEQLTTVTAQDGPLSAFGKTLLDVTSQQLPALGAALQGFVQGGPMGAVAAVFGEMLKVMEPFQKLMEVLNKAFAKVAEIVGQVLAPVFSLIGMVVTHVVNALVEVYNFLLGWLFGRVETLSNEEMPEAPEIRKPAGAAFGMGRSDPSYNPQVALSVGRSNASPAMSSALINVADLFGVHVDSFGAAVDKFVSGSNRFARTNGGL